MADAEGLQISPGDLARLQLDALPVALFVIDARDGRFVDVNQVACDQLGYSRADLLRMGVPQIEALVPVQGPDAWRRHVEQVRREGRLKFEGRHRRKSGDSFPVIISVRAVTMPNGREYLLASALDVSAERELESALVEVESRASAIVSAIPDLFFLVARDSTILEAYTQSDELLAMPRSAFIGKKVEQVLPEEVGRQAHQALERVFSGAKLAIFEYELPLDGVARQWEARVVNRSERDALIVCRDVTELRRAERVLVENSRLSALGELSASIAHELRNPLSAILLTVSSLEAQLGKKPLPAPELALRLSRIGKAARRMSGIMDALMVLGRRDDKDPFIVLPVGELVRDALALCRELFLTRQVELRVTAPDQLTLECRPGQIVQILLNLLTNALDAVQDLPERWCTLSVTGGPEQVSFTVEDSGPGIPEALHARLMQPFFTTKGLGKGTGLGLSISRRLAEAHRGTLTLDKSSKNTRFRLCLPARVNAPA